MTRDTLPPLGAIFDWDGVVIDSHDQHERSWQILAREIGRPLPEGFFKATFGMRNEQIIPGFTGWAAAGETARIRDLADRKEKVYRALLGEDGIEPLPGVVTLLDALAAAGIPTAVGSSTPRENIDTVLALLGLTGRFAAIVAAGDVTHGKPDPEVFVRCAHAIGRSPARCVVFEDSHAGIEAARRAGMKAVALTTTHAAASFTAADLVVPDLSAIGIAEIRALLV